MRTDRQILQRVQDAAGLSRNDLARALSVEEDALGVHDGVLEPVVLRACARLLGVNVADLLRGEIAPAAKLYKALEAAPGARDTLFENGTAYTIGGLVQDLANASLVRRRFDDTPTGLPNWATSRPIAEGSSPPHGADRLAAEVRTHLGLGCEPIVSMFELCATLGVACASVTPDTLPTWIDGFAFRDPVPGITVNLVGGRDAWWRTRMTVAHELAHVLFDSAYLGLTVSTDRIAGPLYGLFEDVEQRANAFAAYLLVPPDGLRALVGVDVTIVPETVGHVCHRYGVGVQTAVNVLTNVYRLSRHARLALLASCPTDFMHNWHNPDARPPEHPARQLSHAVEGAVAADRMHPVEARVLLGLSMSDPLPPGAGPRRRSTLSLARRAHAAVLAHLRASGRHTLAPSTVEVLQDGRLRVRVVGAQRGNMDEEVMTVTLSPDLTVLADAA